MSSLSFHRTSDGRIQKITVKVQFEPRTLKLFDPTLKIDTDHLQASQLTHKKITTEELAKHKVNSKQTKPNSRAGTNTDRRARELNRTWENRSESDLCH
jgi:hypothetical protein